MNKAEKFVKKAAIHSVYTNPDDVYSDVVFAVDRKFPGKKFPPEYSLALDALRKRLGMEW